jgi:hypothetical protein
MLRNLGLSKLCVNLQRKVYLLLRDLPISSFLMKIYISHYQVITTRLIRIYSLSREY